MNEVKKVHLGRQVFVISLSAHSKLKVYLRDIEAESSSKSVAEEVELRMAELLTERGITGDKVVLEKDVEFLQTQLGKATDFKDDVDNDTAQSAEATVTKRLYRDPSRGYVAGVAVGLADYFGIDVVVVRVLLLALVFASGFGVFLYAVLWLLAPVAKTQSDRLQMQGKPVTIESLTHVVKNPEVADKTRKLAQTVRGWLVRATRLGVSAVGVIMLAGALLGLVMVAAATSMIVSHGIFVEQVKVFPLSASEVSLAIIGAITVCFVLLLVAMIGGTMTVRRKLLPAWAMAFMVGLTVVFAALTSGIGASNVTTFESRYESLHYSSQRDVPQFSTLTVRNAQIFVSYETSPTYSVEIRTIGFKDYQLIKTEVANSELVVDAQALDNRTDCVTLCSKQPVEVIVRSPQLNTARLQGRANLEIKTIPPTKNLELIADNTDSNLQFNNIRAQSFAFDISDPNIMRLKVVDASTETASEDLSSVSMTSYRAMTFMTAPVMVTAQNGCTPNNARIFFDHNPPSITINGTLYSPGVFMMWDDASKRTDPTSISFENCIDAISTGVDRF